MAATTLGRAPVNKGDIALAAPAPNNTVSVTAGQKTKRLTFRCDQEWFYEFSGTIDTALTAAKYGPIDANRDWEIHIDDGYTNTVFIETAAAATLQVAAEPR